MCETTKRACVCAYVSLAQFRKYYAGISTSGIIITIIMFARVDQIDVCKEPLENFIRRVDRRQLHGFYCTKIVKLI